MTKVGDLCNYQLVEVVGGKTGRQWLKEGCRTYITVKLETYGITFCPYSGWRNDVPAMVEGRMSYLYHCKIGDLWNNHSVVPTVAGGMMSYTDLWSWPRT